MEKILIIDADCPVAPELFRGFGLKVVFATKMTLVIMSLEIWKQIDPWRTLLVFPGNGSLLVKDQIELLFPGWLGKWPYKSYLPAKRFWEPGQNPVALVGDICRGVYVGITKVIVIDDVISSGETCLKVYKRNFINIPEAKWLAISWVVQKSLHLRNYSEIFPIEVVGEEGKRAPINSLSTLIADREMCRLYANRNFADRAQDFESLINLCRV